MIDAPNTLEDLALAYGVIWSVLCLFVVFLLRSQSNTARRVTQLERREQS